MGSSNVEPENRCHCHDAGGNSLWWSCQQDEILLQQREKTVHVVGYLRSACRRTIDNCIFPSRFPSSYPVIPSCGFARDQDAFLRLHLLQHSGSAPYTTNPKPFASTLTNNDKSRLSSAERSLSCLLFLQHISLVAAQLQCQLTHLPQLRETINVDRGASRCQIHHHLPTSHASQTRRGETTRTAKQYKRKVHARHHVKPFILHPAF